MPSVARFSGSVREGSENREIGARSQSRHDRRERNADAAPATVGRAEGYHATVEFDGKATLSPSEVNDAFTAPHRTTATSPETGLDGLRALTFANSTPSRGVQRLHRGLDHAFSVLSC